MVIITIETSNWTYAKDINNVDSDYGVVFPQKKLKELILPLDPAI